MKFKYFDWYSVRITFYLMLVFWILLSYTPHNNFFVLVWVLITILNFVCCITSLIRYKEKTFIILSLILSSFLIVSFFIGFIIGIIKIYLELK